MKKMKKWLLLSLLLLFVSGCSKATSGTASIDSASGGIQSTEDTIGETSEDRKQDETPAEEDEENPDEDSSEPPKDDSEQEEPETDTEPNEQTEPDSSKEEEEEPSSETPVEEETSEAPQKEQLPIVVNPSLEPKTNPSVLPKSNQKWDGYYSISTNTKEHLLIIRKADKKMFKFSLQTYYYGQNYGKRFIEGVATIKGNTATYKTTSGNCVLTFTDKGSAMVIKTNTCSAFNADKQRGFTFAGTYTHFKTDPRWSRTYTFGNMMRGSQLTLSHYNGEDVKVTMHSWQKANVPSDYNTYFSEYAKIENIQGPAVKASYAMVPNPCSFYVAVEGKEAYVGSANCVTKNGGRLMENYPYMKAS